MKDVIMFIHRLVARYNFLTAAILCILFFFIFLYLFHLVELEGKLWVLASLLMGVLAAFGSKSKAPLLTSSILLFRGEDTGLRVGAGIYFTFFGLWSIDASERHTLEKMDVVLPIFQAQDNRGKNLNVDANGDWEVSNSEAYKLHPASKMEGNLMASIKRTAVRKMARLPYRADDRGEQIQGEQIGELVLGDDQFQRECTKYGVRFTNLIITAVATDLTQENINAYYDELYAKEISKYGEGTPSHQQMEDIEERIQVKMKLAQKFISDAPVINRRDIM